MLAGLQFSQCLVPQNELLGDQVDLRKVKDKYTRDSFQISSILTRYNLKECKVWEKTYLLYQQEMLVVTLVSRALKLNEIRDLKCLHRYGEN